jgi:hypothetical protein
MKPRTIASSPEISITPSRIRSRIVIGIGWSGRSQVQYGVGLDSAPSVLARGARPISLVPQGRTMRHSY